jgi:hypothetical protein
VSAGVATATPVTAAFSYTFDSTHVFTGSLSGELHDQGTGTTSDDYIDGVTALTAQLNGVNLRGPLFLGAYDHSGRRDDLPERRVGTCRCQRTAAVQPCPPAASHP